MLGSSIDINVYYQYTVHVYTVISRGVVVVVNMIIYIPEFTALRNIYNNNIIDNHSRVLKYVGVGIQCYALYVSTHVGLRLLSTLLICIMYQIW